MSAHHTPTQYGIANASAGLKPFGVFVGGAGVVWHRSEDEAKAQAARLQSMGFDVVVALHPALAKGPGSAA